VEPTSIEAPPRKAKRAFPASKQGALELAASYAPVEGAPIERASFPRAFPESSVEEAELKEQNSKHHQSNQLFLPKSIPSSSKASCSRSKARQNHKQLDPH